MIISSALVQDITERKRAETETIALKNALAVELAAMTRLHEFSTRLLAETDIQRLLEEVLDAIVALQSADLGILQLYNRDTRTLRDCRRIEASRPACARALPEHRRRQQHRLRPRPA